MLKKNIFFVLTSLVLAFTVTVTVFYLDQGRFRASRSKEARRIAKQIVSEASGLAVNAKIHGEKDPLGWAANILSQGEEPRVLEVSKIKIDGNTEIDEITVANWKNSIYEYSKITQPENAEGVKVKIKLSYPGFLGTSSSLANDSSVALFFLCFFSIFYIYGKVVLKGKPDGAQNTQDAAKSQELSNESNQESNRESKATLQDVLASVGVAPDVAPNLSPNLSGEMDDDAERDRKFTGFVERTYANVQQQSVAIRDILREANRLAASAGKSRVALIPVRDQIHTAIRNIRDMRKKASLVASAENAEADRVLRQMEMSLEPLATDADIAFHSYQEVLEASKEMSQQVTKAKDVLVNQARLMEDLQKAA